MRTARQPALVALAVLLGWAGVPAAGAVTLSLQSETTPHPGVVLRKYKTTDPTTNSFAVLVDLCAARLHVDATSNPSGYQSVSAWAQQAGVQVAVNGDFYKFPLQVYGKAIGQGVEWPAAKQGIDPAWSSDWYYRRFGWIAFGHDFVEFTHTKWVKQNVGGLAHGWKPKSVVTSHPPGTLALVSGFSELVIEGSKVTCSSPTASDCFPDRSDMRQRHPRTAMGITADRQTFILLVVDGRTTASKGMYGVELADVMTQLGAWQAFNLDGGGSSQLWVQGQGTVNDANGNNSGNGLRAVANHWGIRAGVPGGQPVRPGHCVTEPPCQALGPGGGTIDDTSPCFVTFGPPEYWRSEPVGYGGGLRWTNAWSTALPSNWAWWRVEAAEAGTYRVDYHATPQYAVWSKVHYEVRAAGKTKTLSVDQSSANGWVSLGEYAFDAGGEQWVAIFDDATGAVPPDQHLVADAIRLTRLDPWCGDGACNGDESCEACAADCGACEWCGDGACTGGEDCAGCPEDCGGCPPNCGDGTCDADEDCGACPGDCGGCPPACGDGTCNGDEGCATCPADCGACPPWCGDGACNGAETCETCSDDCPCAPPEPTPDAGSTGSDTASPDTTSPAPDIWDEPPVPDPGPAEPDPTAPDPTGPRLDGGSLTADPSPHPAGATGGGCSAGDPRSSGPAFLLAFLVATGLWARRRGGPKRG